MKKYKDVKKKRKPSAYNLFIKKKIKEGYTLTEAAHIYSQCKSKLRL